MHGILTLLSAEHNSISPNFFLLFLGTDYTASTNTSESNLMYKCPILSMRHGYSALQSPGLVLLNRTTMSFAGASHRGKWPLVNSKLI